MNEDPEVRSEALAALDMGVLHQSSLYTVTAPAALFVAAILHLKGQVRPCEVVAGRSG
ncbi:hypothetical protein ACWGIA_39185 [Streptomyces bobili]